jgi:hypothetical protein
MSATELLKQLQNGFPAGQNTGKFDATQVLAGKFVPLLTGLGVPTNLALSSNAGWQTDGTHVTLTGTSVTTILGVPNPAVYFWFTPSGTDWDLVLDVALPAAWSFGQSFPLLALGTFADLQLDASPAALVISSGLATDPRRVVNGTPMPLAVGVNFYGTFAANSSALSQVAWILGGGNLPLTTGAIAYSATTNAVSMQIPVTTARLDDLFGPSGPHLTFTVSLYSGLNEPLNQYECGIRFDTKLTIGSGSDIDLWALITFSAQPILDLNITGTALAFPGTATLERFFGANNGIAAALPAQFKDDTSLVQVEGITFGIGLQSKSLEYAVLSVDALTGHPWKILPGVIELENINFLFSIFEPLQGSPTWAFDFSAVFTLGNVPILIQAELPGEVLSGGLDPTKPNPSLVPLVKKVFGFTNDLPETLEISRLDFSADILQKLYSADLEISGDWSFPFGTDNQITFEDLTLGFTDDSTGAAGTLAAKFAINTDNQFDVELDMTAGNTTFKGSWEDTGTPLTFQEIAIALGMYGLPTLPDGLDLGLKRAGFEFDSSQPSFSFAIETALYTGSDPTAGKPASAALVAGKNAQGKWGFIYGMVVGLDQKLDLTNIPLVAKLVPSGDDVIELKDVRIVAATMELPAYTDNPELDTIIGSVVNSGLVLTVNLQIGSAINKSISVRFGGSDDGTSSDTPPVGPEIGFIAPGEPGTALAIDTAGTEPTAAQPGQQVTWIDVQRAFGPVQINRVGFTITTDSKLAILLDAAATLGGLSIGLTGLEAEMPIHSPFIPTFDLAGLQVQFSAPEFSIGGGLEKVPGTAPVEYTGELSLTVGSFGATALGSYTTIGGHPSLFAFVFIDVPLGGPALFFVTGLAGGFGFNRSLQLPTIADVASYPLVKGAMGTLDAKDTLTQLNAFIEPQQNEDWFAAGVRFTSFEMVKSFALLTVAFGTNVEIALLGESTLIIPVSTDENPQGPVAEADLLVLVDVQLTNGVVAVNAQLSPSSYVFSRTAQLTGGFAFYIWFDPSPYAGDFVVTLGGYNPYFTPQPYYPQVPRLGLNWEVSSELAVKGGLYFALTPSVIMAGGSLGATWQSGGIKAWFDAQTDFLIRYKPFHYEIEMAVGIGVSVTVDLWVTSVTITVQVGVDLTLHGPPFGGTAKIDLWIVSFTLTFGPNSHPPTAVSWQEFKSSFLPVGAAPHSQSVAARAVSLAATQDNSVTPTNSLITIAAPTGILRTVTSKGDASSDDATIWLVSSGKLQLVIRTQVPSTVVETPPTITIRSGTDWTTSLGVGPMDAGRGSLSSTLTITIDRDGATDEDDWDATPLLGSVPSGLWSNTSSTMHTDGLVPHALIGVSLLPKPPGGESTLPVRLQVLLAGDPPVRDFTWSGVIAPRGDSFDQSTAMSHMQMTLVDKAVAGARTDILAAIKKQGLCTAGETSVADFAKNAPNLLFAAPALRYLGEELRQ